MSRDIQYMRILNKKLLMKIRVMRNKDMFEKFKTIYNFMFEIFLWVLYIWLAVIAIGLTYIFPKQGIIAIICAIICTIIRRVVARNHREE